VEPTEGSFQDREPRDPLPDPTRREGMPGPLESLAARRQAAWSRRGFLGGSVGAVLGGSIAGAGLSSLLAACAPKMPPTLPRAAWREPPGPIPAPTPDPTPDPTPTRATASEDLPAPLTTSPAPAARGASAFEAALPWAKPRFLWAKAPPIRARLNPMLPVTCVTVHHDGLEDLFWSVRPADVAARIERYRLGHIDRDWADIGYHLVIDRAGVLWQGRSIRWQGAHVQFHNEGNVGVLVMGNFEIQRPTAAQLATLRRVLADLRATYGVARGRIYTHREWEDARTACPGTNLQSRMNPIRRIVEA